MNDIRLLANGLVGNGFSYRGFQAGLDRRPHMIGCDAGTSDYGPGPLGSGRDIKPPASVERDLEIMFEGARRLGIPLIIGSCGVAGAAPHLEGYRRIVERLVADSGRPCRLALIHSDQDPALLKTASAAGRVHPLGPVPPLTDAAIDASTHIVAMAGAAPFIRALDAGADVILAGRCTDPAIYAGLAMRMGASPAIAWHAARSIDKGMLATENVEEGSPVMATLDDTGFTIEPTKDGARCTVKSIAALTMYENPDPWSILQPSGRISAEHCRFEQLDERSVRVSGSEFFAAGRPSVKLEGARPVGHRAAMLVGIRDPRLIAELDDYLDRFGTMIRRTARSLGIAEDSYRFRFLAYGRDAVMGLREPLRDSPPHEIGLLVDILARDEADAMALLARASSTGAKLAPVRGIPAGGNFAAPFSPNQIPIGPAFEWSVWHLLDCADESDPFRIEIMDLQA